MPNIDYEENLNISNTDSLLKYDNTDWNFIYKDGYPKERGNYLCAILEDLLVRDEQGLIRYPNICVVACDYFETYEDSNLFQGQWEGRGFYYIENPFCVIKWQPGMIVAWRELYRPPQLSQHFLKTWYNKYFATPKGEN